MPCVTRVAMGYWGLASAPARLARLDGRRRNSATRVRQAAGNARCPRPSLRPLASHASHAGHEQRCIAPAPAPLAPQRRSRPPQTPVSAASATSARFGRAMKDSHKVAAFPTRLGSRTILVPLAIAKAGSAEFCAIVTYHRMSITDNPERGSRPPLVQAKLRLSSVEAGGTPLPLRYAHSCSRGSRGPLSSERETAIPEERGRDWYFRSPRLVLMVAGLSSKRVRDLIYLYFR